MKRPLLIALFTFGAVFGFGSGFASLGAHAARHHDQHRARFERRVAQVCVDAASQVRPPRRPAADAPAAYAAPGYR